MILGFLAFLHLPLLELHQLLSILDLQLLIGQIVLPEVHLSRSLCRLLLFQLHLRPSVRFFLVWVVQNCFLFPQFFLELATFTLLVAKNVKKFVRVVTLPTVRHPSNRPSRSPACLHKSFEDSFRFELSPELHLTTGCRHHHQRRSAFGENRWKLLLDPFQPFLFGCEPFALGFHIS